MQKGDNQDRPTTSRALRKSGHPRSPGTEQKVVVLKVKGDLAFTFSSTKFREGKSRSWVNLSRALSFFFLQWERSLSCCCCDQWVVWKLINPHQPATPLVTHACVHIEILESKDLGELLEQSPLYLCAWTLFKQPLNTFVYMHKYKRICVGIVFEVCKCIHVFLCCYSSLCVFVCERFLLNRRRIGGVILPWKIERRGDGFVSMEIERVRVGSRQEVRVFSTPSGALPLSWRCELLSWELCWLRLNAYGKHAE